LGSSTVSEFELIIQTAYLCGIPITISGGTSSTWIESIKKLRDTYSDLIIFADSLTMAGYGRLINFNGLSTVILPTEQGKFSFNLNAYSHAMSPSNSESRSLVTSFDENWLETYKNY
jgi:hypothetical protein